MKLMLASSEVHPYSKSGGLGDMVAALAKALGRAGHEVALVTPLYRGIAAKFPELARFEYHIDVPLGAERRQAGVFTVKPSEGVTFYFIDAPEFFDRAGLYGENHFDYPDNARRFVFFSKCVAHLARYLTNPPEVVHVHDWQVGLVPALIRHGQTAEGWSNAPRTVLTIHNLAYQGIFPRSEFALANLPESYFTPAGVEFYGRLNCLKGGIMFADRLTTVSPRYAREITTQEFGCQLDGVLRERQAALVGILNGVDYDEWNTGANPHIPHPYSARDLSGKTSMKSELQTEFGLPDSTKAPLFASVTRLVDQKGVDLLLGALEEMVSAELQFVLLGSGSPELQAAYSNLAARNPRKVGVRLGFDQALSHRIEAGADFFLMPSRFEPCGLNQMYSLRYGTIPIVRATGGLDDTVVDLAEDAKRANGIKFREPSARALARAMRKAVVLFAAPPLRRRVQAAGMKADFSWERTAVRYVEVYAATLISAR
jgi:starch synthase